MIDLISELSVRLSDIRFDEAFTNAVADMLGNQADMDREGNLYINRRNHASVLMIAPCFTYPLAVDKVYEDGSVGFSLHDAHSIAPLPGSDVCIHGRKTYRAVIGSIPPHLQKGYQSGSPYELADLRCDTGAGYDELKENVLPGSRISFSTSLPSRLIGYKIAGRNLELTAPSAALISCAKKLADKEQFTFCFCTNLYSALKATNPDCVIVVDVIDIEHYKREYTHGEGLSRIYIETGISVTPEIRGLLESAADAADIPHARLVRSDKHDEPHTLTWDVQNAMGGIPVGTVYLPYEGGTSGIQIMSGEAADLLVQLANNITVFPGGQNYA